MKDWLPTNLLWLLLTLAGVIACGYAITIHAAFYAVVYALATIAWAYMWRRSVIG